MASTPTTEGLQSTRQLLDELDELMDQMLALPVDDLDGDAASSSAPLGTTPTVSATLTMLESPKSTISEPEAEIQHSRVALVQSTDAGGGAFSWTNVGPNVECTPQPADDFALAPLLAEVAAPPRVDLTLLRPPVHAARWQPSQAGYQFLLWVNQGYDGGTSWLGKPGRWLRSRRCKALLGLGGIGLIVLAFAWLCRDWLGWNW